MALGAESGTIIGLVFMKAGTQLGMGIVLGLALGAATGRSMRHILYGVETGDLSVYGSIVVTLLLAGLLACVIPARWALRADPVEAMRAQ